jgi:hypothetical protein
MELAQLVSNRLEEVSCPLREVVLSLKLLLAHIGFSFKPTEACSCGGQELSTVHAPFTLGSAAEVIRKQGGITIRLTRFEEEHLCSRFSPRSSPY